MGLSTAATDKNECQKSNVAGGRHFENRLVAYLCDVPPFLMKFLHGDEH